MDSPQETEHQDHPETNVPPPAQRSAEMPMLWDEAHRSLIDTCVRHESLLELFLQLRRLADVLDENQTMKENDFPVFSTVNSLRHYDWTMCELLHSMSVPVVQSIVKNTFAFDVTNNAIKPFQLPSALRRSERLLNSLWGWLSTALRVGFGATMLTRTSVLNVSTLLERSGSPAPRIPRSSAGQPSGCTASLPPFSPPLKCESR